MTSKMIPLGDVLSVTQDALVSRSHIGGVYEILNFMTGDNLFTHQLPRAAAECQVGAPQAAATRRRWAPTGRRGQVLAALLHGAQDGHEIGARIGCDHNQVATRAKELEEAGLVQRVGRRQGPRRAPVTVYALTVDGRHTATQYANQQDRNAA